MITETSLSLLAVSIAARRAKEYLNDLLERTDPNDEESISEEARTQLTEALKAATDICNHFDAEYQSDGGGGLEQIEGVQ